MQNEDYLKVLEDNPELLRHPEFMFSSRSPSRDFIFSDPAPELHFKVPLNRKGVPSSHFSERRSTGGKSGHSVSAASVYFDAYTGDEAEFFSL